ncbi:TPA: MBL fold metallo-hydrolase [Streptococcus pneumoniae]
MKIYKTVNPVAYENTYYLEGEKHLIVVDPGSHWEAIRQTLEEFRFKVLPTPGHSIGGVSLVFPDAHLVLTGDALFRETIGRTDLPTGSMEQLLHSIQTQLFTLPNYDVYPGHGPATTIAHEKAFNPFF